MRAAIVMMMALSGFSGSAAAAVGEDLNGTWYNPAQSGHGLNIEIVDGERAVALWYSYDLEGRPLTLYLDGQIDGQRIVATAFAPSGLRFAEFDPADLQLPPWGEVDIEFADCEQATLRFRGDDPAYGSGEFPLRRLVQAAPPSCDLQAGPALPPGAYQGSHNEFGYIAADGVFYGAHLYSDGHWPQSLGNSVPALDVLIGAPQARSHGRVRLPLQRLANNWLCHVAPLPGSNQCEVFAPTPRLFHASLRRGKVSAVAWPEDDGEFDPVRSLLGPSSVGLVAIVPAGDYAFPVIGDDSAAPSGRIEVGSDRSLCVRVGDSDCLYRGQLEAVPQGAGGFAFSLQRSDGEAPPIRGRGWMLEIPIVTTRQYVLTLIGRSDDVAMALRTLPTQR